MLIKNNRLKIYAVFSCLLIVVGVVFLNGVFKARVTDLGELSVLENNTNETLSPNTPVSTLSNLSAVSHILMEADSGMIISGKNYDIPRAMASTTKLMTALLGAELLDLDEVLTIKSEQANVEGTSLYLKGGDKISVKDLLTGLMLKSGNDAANVVAYTAAGSIEGFAVLMNERAAEIGMKNTVFVTPSGLDAGNHSSTAYDMALLAREVLKNKVVADICAMESATISFGNPQKEVTIKNGNKLLSRYEYAIGLKTGFTIKARRCLVSAAGKDGVTLIAVTLNAGNDWNDHISLFEHGFTLTKRIEIPKVILPILPVGGGQGGFADLIADVPPSQTVLKDKASKITYDVNLPKFLTAPMKKGDYVGSVRYYIDGQLFHVADVILKSDVVARAKPSTLEMFWKNLKKIGADFFKM